MHGKLKIGLILDGELASKYVHELVDWANKTDALCVSHLIIQSRPPAAGRAGSFYRLLRKSPPKLARDALWRVKTRLESARVARVPAFNGYEKTYDLGKLIPARIRLTPMGSKSGFIYRLSDSELAKVREEGFDLLIRCGSGILQGEILSSARLGVLSFHHGDNRISRGGVAGFWEVYTRHPSTGFIVERLAEAMLFCAAPSPRKTHIFSTPACFSRSHIFTCGPCFCKSPRRAGCPPPSRGIPIPVNGSPHPGSTSWPSTCASRSPGPSPSVSARYCDIVNDGECASSRATGEARSCGAAARLKRHQATSLPTRSW